MNDPHATPPGRIWWDAPWTLYQWPLMRPFYFGGDEYGRRTVCIHIPLLGRLVIAVTKPDYYKYDTLRELDDE